MPKIWAVPTLHPSYVVRDQTYLPVVINDLRKSTVLPPERYNLRPDLDAVKAFDATTFAFDIETSYWWTKTTQITMVGLSAKNYEVLVVPFKGSYISELKRIFRNAKEVIGHNSIQFDLPILQENDISVADDCVLWDTMLMQHLRFPDLPHDLEFVGSMFSNKPAWKSDKKDFELYCARDVDVTIQAFNQLKPMLKQYNLDTLYHEVQVPLAKICRLMQTTGFKINPNQIHTVREKLLAEMKVEEANLPEHLRSHMVKVNKRKPAPAGTLSAKTGKPLKFIMEQVDELETPWRSPDVIEKYLYTELALPIQLDLKSDRVTTGKMALDKLYRKTKNRSILALRKLRQMNSLVTLFCKETMTKIDRMHPHFNVHGTACLSPETLVCTTDLRWIPISETEVGTSLIGFNEEGIWRKLQPSKVLEKQDVYLDTYEIYVDGKVIRASSDHGWLVRASHHPKGQGRFKWIHTRDLREGHQIAYWKEPWYYRDSRDAGYLAGFFDGEGCLNSQGGLYGTQTENACLAEVRAALNREFIPFTDIHRKDPKKPNIKAIYVHDGISIVGSLRPPRLIAKAERTWNGKTAYGKGGTKGIITNIQHLGKRPLVGIRTETQTFLAEGYLSHNSGRLSSSDPNLQNVPETARYIYVPSHAGWKIIDVDYSQIENRLTAYFADDQERMGRFITDPKFSEHKFAASLFLNIPYDEVEKDNDKDAPYGKAKRIVHGTNYGMGAKKISLMYDMDFKDTKLLQEKWKNAIWKTIQWQNRCADEAKKNGYLTTPFGRKRWFYTTSYYTESLSFLPQSTAADVIFRSMLALMHERIGLSRERVSSLVQHVEPLPRPVNLLLQVHDSLIFESPAEMVDEIVALVKRVMEQPWKELGGLSIPIGVKVGDSWGECE